MKPYDPPGYENRRWFCKNCHAIGTLKELMANDCTVPYKAGDQEAALLDALKGKWP